jgi:hypothetical protein
MTSRPLPSWLRDMIANPPIAGDGVHNWLYRVSRHLHAHFPAVEIVKLIESAVANCGRHVRTTEIVSAVQSSLSTAWQPHGAPSPKSQTPARKWPDKNLRSIEEICTNGAGLVGLWEASPVRFEDFEPHTEEIIDRMFPGNPLLCCGQSEYRFDTKRREVWRGELTRFQFLVPSPMTAVTGLTTAGKVSRHSLCSTGPRRFLVDECDFSIYARDGKSEMEVAPLIRKLEKQGIGIADMCAAVLLHLAEYAPLVLVVHSGGKSLHGWFYVQDQPEKKVLQFMRYACSLGADHMTWTRSQFVRMPDGMRDNVRRQTVYFYNPGLLKTPS